MTDTPLIEQLTRFKNDYDGSDDMNYINSLIDKTIDALEAQQWKPIETAPKDGTWILGINNRGNCAVIIWAKEALDGRGGLANGWIHPFSDMTLSGFWNGDCGSVATHWQPLPHPPVKDINKSENEKELWPDGTEFTIGDEWMKPQPPVKE